MYQSTLHPLVQKKKEKEAKRKKEGRKERKKERERERKKKGSNNSIYVSTSFTTGTRNVNVHHTAERRMSDQIQHRVYQARSLPRVQKGECNAKKSPGSCSF